MTRAVIIAVFLVASPILAAKGGLDGYLAVAITMVLAGHARNPELDRILVCELPHGHAQGVGDPLQVDDADVSLPPLHATNVRPV
jgi:hypothetical protein